VRTLATPEPITRKVADHEDAVDASWFGGHGELVKRATDGKRAGSHFLQLSRFLPSVGNDGWVFYP